MCSRRNKVASRFFKPAIPKFTGWKISFLINFTAATSRSCHPAPILVHLFCLCSETLKLVRIDLLTRYVQGCNKSHTQINGSEIRLAPGLSQPLNDDHFRLWPSPRRKSCLANRLSKFLSSRELEIHGKDFQGLLGPLLLSSVISSATDLIGGQSVSI